MRKQPTTAPLEGQSNREKGKEGGTMADGEEENAGAAAEGEEPEAQAEPVVDKRPRYSYAVALVAGVGVNLDKLVDDIAGTAPALSVLKFQEIMDAEDVPEQLEAVKALGEGVAPPTDLVAKQICAVLKRPWPEEVPAPPEGDSPGNQLMGLPNGPRKYYVVPDLALTEELAREHVEGGFIDAVLLVTRPPPVIEKAPSGEAPPEEDEEAKKAREEEEQKAIRRVEVFQALKRMAGDAPPALVDKMADVSFGEVSWVNEEEPAKAVEEIAKVLEVFARAKIEYVEWGDGVPVHDAKMADSADRRHYDLVLSSVPDAVLSVPIVLHALIEQAIQNSSTGGVEVGDDNDGGDGQNPKGIVDVVDDGLRVLKQEEPMESEKVRAQRAQVSIFHKGDERHQRLGQPELTPQVRDNILAYEERVTSLVHHRLPAEHPEVECKMDQRSVGLEMTELLAMVTPGTSVKQLQRGLILSEVESMVGYLSDAQGNPVSTDAWVMDEIALEDYTYQEEHTASAMRELLTRAMELEPEFLASYYPRDDLVLVVVCNEVPFGRVKEKSWAAGAACFSGFWQWLEARFGEREKVVSDLKDEDARERQEEAKAAEASFQQVKKEEPKEGEEGEEGDGGAPKESPRKAALDARIEGLELPMPQKPKCVYRMAHSLGTSWQKDHVMYMSNGGIITAGESTLGRHVKVATIKHTVHMRSDMGHAGQYGLSVSYDDGTLAVARRVVGGGMSVSMCFPDGLFVTVKSDGNVWQSRPRGIGGERTHQHWLEYAAKVEAELKPRGKLELDGELVKGINEKEGLLSMLTVEGGTVVKRYADGRVQALLADSCVGTTGGGGEWLWTNSKGRRVRRKNGKSSHGGPPVSVERFTDPETGEDITSRGDLVLCVARRDRSKMVQHACGLQIVSRNEGGTTQHVSFEGYASVKLGPDGGQRVVTAADGTFVTLIGGKVEVFRPDGSLLQFQVSNGKAIFYPEGKPTSPIDADEGTVGRGTAKGHKARFEEASQASMGSKIGAKVAMERRASTVGGGQSVKSMRTSRTDGEGAVSKRAGTLSFSLSAGTFSTDDHAGNAYSVSGTGQVKNVILAVGALKQRNNDAISAADEARNKLAMEATSGENLRPPSPQIESEPGPRLEPYRVLVLRRDGSGCELVRSTDAETSLRLARESGCPPLVEPLPDDPGAISYTIVKGDHRWSPRSMAEELTPLSIAAHGLRHKASNSTTAVSLHHLIHYPPLATEAMVAMRTLVERHREWRDGVSEAADALYLADERSDKDLEDEAYVQARIVDARAQLAAAAALARETSGSRPGTSMAMTARTAATGALMTDVPKGTATKGVLKPYPPSTQRSPVHGVDPRSALKKTVDTTTSGMAQTMEATNTMATTFGEAPQEEIFVVPEWCGATTFRCYPGAAAFGVLELRKRYRIRLSLLNAGVEYSKFRLRQPKNSTVSVIYHPQQVAAGMSAPLEVEISCTSTGDIKDELHILSEGESFPVPIRATVVDKHKYHEMVATLGYPPEAEGVVCVDSVPLGCTLAQTRALDAAAKKSKGGSQAFGELQGMTLGEIANMGKTKRKSGPPPLTGASATGMSETGVTTARTLNK